MLYLGFVQDVCGSMLYLMATQYHADVSLESALLVLWLECRAWYKSRSIRCAIHKFTHATISWDDKNDYPCLASSVKGSNDKMIFIWLAHASSQVVVSGVDISADAKLRASMMWGLLRFIDILDHADIFLSSDEVWFNIALAAAVAVLLLLLLAVLLVLMLLLLLLLPLLLPLLQLLLPWRCCCRCCWCPCCCCCCCCRCCWLLLLYY